MGMDPQAACAMDVALCERHIGAQPGGGICAICLQERLIQLWRGEGNFTWNMEEFSVTPQPCKTPSVAGEPSRENVGDAEASTSACFPVIFRVRHLQRGGAHEREKIDRSSDREHQFSCDVKSIVKELAALHERKKLERAGKKRAATTDRGSVSVLWPSHEEHAAEVTQGAVSASPGPGDAADAAGASPSAALPNTTKAKVSIVGDEEADEEEARYGKAMCFSALWPAIANMKWARVLVSPIISSNKIAPSKSDLLTKLVGGLPNTAAGEEARAESGRNCVTSGSLRANIDIEFDNAAQAYGMPGAAAGAALLPPRYGQPPADEDGTVIEIDKETKLRMEASRITVMTWLQSLPSPKAAHMSATDPSGHSPLSENSHSPLPGHHFPDAVDLSVGNGVLEMCDEEEMEFACPSHPTEIQRADRRLPDDPDFNHINSFGKFLRSSSLVSAPTRMVDMEISAQ